MKCLVNVNVQGGTRELRDLPPVWSFRYNEREDDTDNAPENGEDDNRNCRSAHID